MEVLLAVALIVSAAVQPGLVSVAKAAEPEPAKSSTEGRNFYQVLEDLLADFEYDLKNGQVSGLKDLAIRNIATSENIPPSFKQHLELVVTERILKTTRTRLVQCLACKSKRTSVTGDQVMITSPDNNPVELARIAKLSGIAHFMDLAFSYQPGGMVLSMTITEPENGAITWSRSYNSETSRSSAFRRGVDYSQVEDARQQTEYQPMISYRITGLYLFEPNTTGTTGVVGFGFRMVERYDNRKKEVGFEIDYLMDSSTVAGGGKTTTSSTNLWSGFNMTLLFIHAWNLIGPEENYNRVRGSIFAGIGGTYASGFLGGLVRGGYEWRLAKHWAVQISLGLRPAGQAFLGGTSVGSVSGTEYGFGISGIF